MAQLTFEQKREQLKRCLAREYRSFFKPFEADFYVEDVTFQDPLNKLEGKDKYKGNVEMLSGENVVGQILFKDGFIDLHAVEDVPGDERRLRTRWTLGFTFKLLPWQPKALFSGVSEYTIDANAKVLTQRDYWDTINLAKAGTYAPEPMFAGLGDLGEQLLPSFLRQSQDPPASISGSWVLLRRAAEYRVYRDRNDGRVFAIAAPGAPLDAKGISQALSGHQLKPGQGLRVDLSGRGQLWPASEAAPVEGTVPGVELLVPHPWEGEAPE